MKIKLFEFDPHTDSRGSLVAVENNKDIPFEIKRVYYIYGTPNGIVRGFHAHKKLNQVLICVSGRCKIILDDGMEREEVVLDKPNVGLYIGNDMWREMADFSKDAVLLVLASELYDNNDYIRDHDEFLKFVGERG